MLRVLVVWYKDGVIDGDGADNGLVGALTIKKMYRIRKEGGKQQVGWSGNSLGKRARMREVSQMTRRHRRAPRGDTVRSWSPSAMYKYRSNDMNVRMNTEV